MIWQSLSPLKHCTLVSSWIPVQPFSVLSCTFIFHFACTMLSFCISMRSFHLCICFACRFDSYASLWLRRTYLLPFPSLCRSFVVVSMVLWLTLWFTVTSRDPSTRAMARLLGSFSKASALPAADVLLAVIFLRWFWSRSWLVLLHYPHTACLYWSTPTHRETEHVCSDLPDQLKEFVQGLTIKTGNLNRLKKPL